jgi:hypothetical protein
LIFRIVAFLVGDRKLIDYFASPDALTTLFGLKRLTFREILMYNNTATVASLAVAFLFWPQKNALVGDQGFRDFS